MVEKVRKENKQQKETTCMNLLREQKVMNLLFNYIYIGNFCMRDIFVRIIKIKILRHM